MGPHDTLAGQFSPQYRSPGLTYDYTQSYQNTMHNCQVSQANSYYDQNHYLHYQNPVQYLGRCTCKKSACLKLYCQCFANSMYCSRDCQCVNCYNSVYYKEMVHVAKGKIAEKSCSTNGRSAKKSKIDAT